MESKNFYKSGMYLKIFIKNNGVSKILQSGKAFLQRSSGLSNEYMDTTLGLYVEHKDRINKKTTLISDYKNNTLKKSLM